MKRTIALKKVRDHAPSGFTLPPRFEEFVSIAAATDPTKTAWFEVAWTDPREFELKAEAARELLPFLRLGDGGIVAFWTSSQGRGAIVHFDSEGERHVVASNFEDFLARLPKRRTGVPDIDDGHDLSPFTRMKPTPRPVALKALAIRFKAWCKQASALEEPTVSSDGERVRAHLYAIARKMIADGLQYGETSRSQWWSIDFKARRTKQGVEATYLDYGKWRPVPPRYEIEPVLAELVAMTKHPKRLAYEVCVLSTGLVTVDRDRELVLEAEPTKTRRKK